jgi:peroxiredoxin
MRKSLLAYGEPAPWFTAACTSNNNFHFSSVGGRYVVLSFFESARRADSRRILQDIFQSQGIFDDYNACYFGVTIDPDDQRLERVREQLPGIRFFWDFDKSISLAYGAIDAILTDVITTDGAYRAHSLVLDPLLRVVASIPFDNAMDTHVQRLAKILSMLPPVGPPTLAAPQAPVLVVPRIFEPELCRMLIRRPGYRFYARKEWDDGGSSGL